MTLRTRGQWSGTLEVTRKGDKQENDKQECHVGLRPPGGHSSRDTAPPGGAEVVATGRDSPPCSGTGAAANAPRRPRGNIIVRQKLNYEIRKQ